MDLGPYREAAPLDPSVVQRRAELCKPLAGAVIRVAIVFAVVLTTTLGAVAIALSALRADGIVIAAGGAFVLIPTLVVASVLRARRIALRFMRETTPLLGFLDEGGLVLLSPDGLFREGKGHVRFAPERGVDDSLARVTHDPKAHALSVVVLWKSPGKRPRMEEREHKVPLPPSMPPARAAAAAQQLAALRGCAFTTA